MKSVKWLISVITCLTRFRNTSAEVKTLSHSNHRTLKDAKFIISKFKVVEKQMLV